MTRARTPLAVAIASLVALTACTETSQLSDPNNPNRNTQQGAILGGVAGAIAGIAAGDDPDERRRGAVLGAALGTGGGALIGRSLDRQEAELRAQLDDRVRIVNTGNELIVTMPQDILFPVDSATLRPDLQSDLRALATNLQNYPATTVEIIGHTDNTGSAAYNQDLSARRANSVASILIGSGVSPSRIRAFGRGEDQPVATNLTAEGRQLNRRVEIIIRPTA